MAIIHITTPLKTEDVEKLCVGDKILITGMIYSARDAAHKRLADMIREHRELPFDLEGQIIYYLAPSPAKPGMPIGSAGPTSSYRIDPYTPTLLEAGLKGMIGKGTRSQAVIDLMKEKKAVYFLAVGGAAVVMAESVISAKVIAFPELEAEAILEMKVKNMPVFVANDVRGNDIFQVGVQKYCIKK